jgi:hypothetical protein
MILMSGTLLEAFNHPRTRFLAYKTLTSIPSRERKLIFSYPRPFREREGEGKRIGTLPQVHQRRSLAILWRSSRLASMSSVKRRPCWRMITP